MTAQHELADCSQKSRDLSCFEAWDVFIAATFCSWDLLSLGHFVTDVFETFCSWDLLSWDVFEPRRFVLGRFVRAPHKG